MAAPQNLVELALRRAAEDLRALLRVASPKERARARRALDAIQRRGFGRKRNLRAAFARALRDARG